MANSESASLNEILKNDDKQPLTKWLQLVALVYVILLAVAYDADR